MDRATLRLLVVTPGDGEVTRLPRLAEQSFAGGATALWVRERAFTPAVLRVLLRDLLPIARAHAAALIVSGEVALAAELGLDAVHLGFRDAPPATLRRQRPGLALPLGFSAHDPLDRQAIAAADYVTLSPVFATPAKRDLVPPLGLARFAALVEGIACPVVALGGIDVGTAADLIRAGASGVCVMRAVTQAADPRAAAAEIRAAIDAVSAP